MNNEFQVATRCAAALRLLDRLDAVQELVIPNFLQQSHQEVIGLVLDGSPMRQLQWIAVLDSLLTGNISRRNFRRETASWETAKVIRRTKPLHYFKETIIEPL